MFLLPFSEKSATILNMKTVKVNVSAKLNLTLDLLGKAGGYHQLDSLVTSVDLSDQIVVRTRKDAHINVTMHGMGSESIPPEANHAFRAAEAFREKFQTAGADITVYKNIPMGAGMGGSSADAAGVLNALSKAYGIEKQAEIEEIADSLGSDIKYMLRGGFQRMRGRGELLEPLPISPKLYFLLLVPKSGVSTAACYQKSDEFEAASPVTERAIELFNSGDLEGAAKWFSNGLYRAAAELNPEVKKAYEELESFSPWGVSMTGSGSAVFAIFETPELCAWAKSRYRGKSRAILLKSKE